MGAGSPFRRVATGLLEDRRLLRKWVDRAGQVRMLAAQTGMSAMVLSSEAPPMMTTMTMTNAVIRYMPWACVLFVAGCQPSRFSSITTPVVTRPVPVLAYARQLFLIALRSLKLAMISMTVPAPTRATTARILRPKPESISVNMRRNRSAMAPRNSSTAVHSLLDASQTYICVGLALRCVELCLPCGRRELDMRLYT